jgi:DMSO/TMAO reductase YedYZ molybdopterin-dependent catalytic subunit
MRVLSLAGLRKILRAPAGRITNQTLLVALVLVFGTGVATVAIGSPSGRWADVGDPGLHLGLVLDWSGVPVSALLRNSGSARSLLVHSVTGYWIRLPVSDVRQLLLATRVGGVPLSAGHGYPLRLVAPGRRGYWWVKWVDRIELLADKETR